MMNLYEYIDLKESIPQFYDPKSGVDLLLNLSGLQLGVTQNDTIINDVELPNWAKSPKDFLKKNRKALESDYCSHFLPKWIDLIFGEKSRGTKAEEAMNIFHPTSYLSPQDVEVMDSEEEKITAELQATEFGICPDMLFCAAHPRKHDNPNDAVRSLNKNNNRASDVDFNGKYIGNDDEEANAESKEWELLSSHDSNPYQSKSNEDQQIFSQSSSNGTKDQSSWITDAADDVSIEQRQQQQQYNQEKAQAAVLDENFYSIEENNDGRKMKNMPLSGSGDGNRNSDETTSLRNGTFGASQNENEEKKLSNAPMGTLASSNNSFDNTNQTSKNLNEHGGWKLKSITSKQMHSDSVSGCYISLGTKSSNMTTTSLDGSLMVHILPSSLTEQQNTARRGFSSTAASSSLTRFSFMGKSSATNDNRNHDKSINQIFHTFRSHTSSDPLACLAVVSEDGDNNNQSKNYGGNHIAFAGGHDGVILAYGVNSACGLASVYSHPDTITSLDVVPIDRNDIDDMRDMGTHILISGSWDATVKLWNVSITRGEIVDIINKPFMELFDAESSVSDVAGVLVNRNTQGISKKSILVAAGCTDGSLTIWSCTGQGKETPYLQCPTFILHFD